MILKWIQNCYKTFGPKRRFEQDFPFIDDDDKSTEKSSIRSDQGHALGNKLPMRPSETLASVIQKQLDYIHTHVHQLTTELIEIGIYKPRQDIGEMELKKSENTVRVPNRSSEGTLVLFQKETPKDVWTNVVVLKKLFSFLETRDLMVCRRVCKVWNSESMLLLSTNSKIEVNVYRKVPWDEPEKCPGSGCLLPSTRSERFECMARPLFVFLQWMSQDQMSESIFSKTKFSFNNHPFLKSPEHGHVILLRDFGWMIHRLDICIEMISDLIDVFRYCRNLKQLTVQVEVKSVVTVPATGSEPLVVIQDEKNRFQVLDGSHLKRIATDYTDYRLLDPNKEAVLEHLECLDMSYNVQWNFGYFLLERTPNLVTFACTESCPFEVDYSNLIGFPPDPLHSVNELGKLKTGQIRSLDLDFRYDSKVEGNLQPEMFRSILRHLTKLDLSSLRSFSIRPHGSFQSASIPTEFWHLLSNVSSTLETLYISSDWLFDVRNGGEVPYLPKVTYATFPHCIITSSKFFKKLPSLEDLLLTHFISKEFKEWASLTHHTGFYPGNITMWQEYGPGTHRHTSLKKLTMEIGEHYKIPEALPRMFPNLAEIHVQVSSKSLDQLSILMPLIRDWESVRVFQVSPESTPRDYICFNLEEDLDSLYKHIDEKIVLVLLGVALDITADVIVALNFPKDVMKTCMTGCGLHHLTHLRKFTLKCRTERDRMAEVLETYCFSEMSKVVQKQVITHIDVISNNGP